MQEEPTPHAAEPSHTPDRHGLLALSIYLTFSLLVFGRTLPGHFRDAYIGTDDPSALMWFLVWWPHALVHHLDPFFTDLLWAPSGINLAWTTSIPLPSFVIWPLTASVGPIAAYNVLCLASLPLGAWTAFLFCRHICRAWWPSLLGGYIFGFSAYMLGHQAFGQLNLTLVFLVPVGGLLVVRAIAGELALGRFVAAMVALLVAQFLISIEVFATMTEFGGMALLLGWSFAPSDTGKRILRALRPIAIAYAIAAVILSPYLYSIFAFGAPRGAIWSLHSYSSDLLNFVVPAPTSEFGVIPLISRLSAPFRPYGIAEVDAYLGLPLIILAAAYAWWHWREPTGKLLVDSLIITCVLAMGPLLHFRGAVLGGAPGKILAMLPALNKALPARFMMYAFLLLAIIASIWFAANQFGAATKIALAVMMVVSTLPNLSGSYWTQPRRFARIFYHRALIAATLRRARMYWCCRLGFVATVCCGRPRPGCTSGWRADTRERYRRSFATGRSSTRSSTRRICPTWARNSAPLWPTTKSTLSRWPMAIPTRKHGMRWRQLAAPEAERRWCDALPRGSGRTGALRHGHRASKWSGGRCGGV